MTRFAGLLAPLVIVATLVSCTNSPSVHTGKKTVIWDLTTPKTTRQLGGTSDQEVVVESAVGGLVEVELRLPQTTVVTTASIVTGTPSDITGDLSKNPVGEVQFIDHSSPSLAALRVVTDRFVAEWSLPPDQQAKLDAFYTDATAKIAAAGAIRSFDWNLHDVFGFTGVQRDGVTPAMTISVNDGSFSDYRVLRWDPNG